MSQKTVCMISCLHSVFDDRIYWKECITLKNHNYTVYHIGFGEKNKEFLTEEGIHIIEISRRRYFTNPYIDKLYRIITFKKSSYNKIFSAAKRIKADVYHIHDLQINRLNKKLKQLEHKPKLIYDVHEYYPDLVLSNFRRVNPFWFLFKAYSIYTKLWEISKSKYCDFIITVGPRIEKHFLTHCKETPTKIIYNFTTLVPKDNSGAVKKYDVIYLGAINKNRGIFEIIKTASLLKKHGRNISFLILGPFHHKQTERKTRKLIEKLGLSDSFEIHEPVNYQRVEEFLSQSRIALSIFLPVKIFYYAIQVKTFEYMANGLPIVCSNFGMVNKFVTESQSGIPVNPLKTEEIADAITFLLDDPEQYTLMSKNGIGAVKNRYNWEQMEDILLGIYRDLLN